MFSKLNPVQTPRLIIYTLALLIIPFVGFSQDDSLHTVNQKIAEAHCNAGKGNSAFKITLPQLEAVILGKYNQKALLRLLPKYVCQFNLSFGGDVKTGEFDIPEFEFNYAYVDGNFNPTGITLRIVIEGNIHNRIESIQIGGISASMYDNFLNILNKNYLYRGSISTSREKHFVNKAKSLVIILYKNPGGTYSIEIV